ncbi:hypothetical protein N9J18_00990 [Porticoccaceae bacterium]|nr:hypothetical protein [Porticoccaceae bacterium]
MSGQWEGGKGSKQRKTGDQNKFDSNWDAIFGKKDKPSAVDDCAEVTAESAANEKQNSVSEKSS